MFNCKLIDESEIPYEYSFAIKHLWSIQSNAFDKSVGRAPNCCPLYIDYEFFYHN